MLDLGKHPRGRRKSQVMRTEGSSGYTRVATLKWYCAHVTTQKRSSILVSKTSFQGKFCYAFGGERRAWKYYTKQLIFRPALHPSSPNMQAPVVVLSMSFPSLFCHRTYLTSRTDTGAGDRQFGRKAQLSNITAAKT